MDQILLVECSWLELDVTNQIKQTGLDEEWVDGNVMFPTLWADFMCREI